MRYIMEPWQKRRLAMFAKKIGRSYARYPYRSRIALKYGCNLAKFPGAPREEAVEREEESTHLH